MVRGAINRSCVPRSNGRKLEIDIATSRYDIIALTETLGQLYIR